MVIIDKLDYNLNLNKQGVLKYTHQILNEYIDLQI